ncbi:MAG: DNA-binding protein, partial [Methanomicrobiales archaeon]|nr:DNA-binding protein [Methanomicrobiales archaeon]
MGDDELAALRRRRMAELQRQTADQQVMEEELRRQQEADAQIHLVLMQILEPEARERLNNIRL